MRQMLIAAILLAGTTPAIGQSSVGTYTELERTPIADSEGLELVMGLIEQGGTSQSPKHLHPRGETIYVLEGTVNIVGEGDVSRDLKAGDSFHQPPGEWHIVRTGPAGAKAVIVRVLKPGEAPTQEVK